MIVTFSSGLPMANIVFIPSFIYLPNQFANVSWQAMYLIGTTIVGILILYEAIILKRYQGKLPNKFLFNVSSILETAWFFVSITALYYAKFATLVKVVPVAYTIYSVFGWFYTFYLLKDQFADAQSTDDIDEVIVPPAYVNYSLSFSLVIIATSLCFLLGLLYYGKIVLP